MKIRLYYLLVILFCSSSTYMHSMALLYAVKKIFSKTDFIYTKNTTLAEVQDFLQENSTTKIYLENLNNNKPKSEDTFWQMSGFLANTLFNGDESALCALIPNFDNSLLTSNEFAQWLLTKPDALKQYLNTRIDRLGKTEAQRLINQPLTRTISTGVFEPSTSVEHTLLSIAGLDFINFRGASYKAKPKATETVKTLLNFGSNPDIELNFPALAPVSGFVDSFDSYGNSYFHLYTQASMHLDGYIENILTQGTYILSTLPQGLPHALLPRPNNNDFCNKFHERLFCHQQPIKTVLLYYLFQRGITQEVYEAIAPYSKNRTKIQYLEKPTNLYNELCRNAQCSDHAYKESLAKFEEFFKNFGSNATTIPKNLSPKEFLDAHYFFKYHNVSTQRKYLEDNLSANKEICVVRMLIENVFPVFYPNPKDAYSCNSSGAIKFLNTVLENYSDNKEIVLKSAKSLMLIHANMYHPDTDNLTSFEIAEKIFGASASIDGIEKAYTIYKKYLQVGNNSTLEAKYKLLNERHGIYHELYQDLKTDQINVLQKYKRILHEKAFFSFTKSLNNLPPLLPYALTQNAENSLCFMVKQNLIPSDNNLLEDAIRFSMPCLINEILKKLPAVNNQTLDIIPSNSRFITNNLVSTLYKRAVNVTANNIKKYAEYSKDHGHCNGILDKNITLTSAYKPFNPLDAIQSLDTPDIMKALSNGITAETMVNTLNSANYTRSHSLALFHVINNALKAELPPEQLVTMLSQFGFKDLTYENPNTIRCYMRVLKALLFPETTTVFTVRTPQYTDIIVESGVAQ